MRLGIKKTVMSKLTLVTDQVLSMSTMKVIILFLIGLIYGIEGFIIPDAKVVPLCPLGVDIILPDSPGIKYVSVQVNINEPIAWPSSGSYSNSSTAADNAGSWRLHLSDVILNLGDTIYYWLHVIYRQTSTQSTMLSWTVQDDPCNQNSHACQQSVTRILNLKSPCKGDLIFSEEFNDTSFEQWDHDILAPDAEFQLFINNRSNSFIKDSLLHVRATFTSDWIGEETLLHGAFNFNDIGCVSGPNESCYLQAVGGMIISPTLSARLTTRHTFNFMFGRLEFRARVPNGLWLWPEITLMPRYHAYGGDKYTSGVLTPLRGSQRNILALIGDGVLRSNIYNGNIKLGEFNTYTLLWNPEKLEFLIDGNVVGIFLKGSNGIWKDASINSQLSELYKLYGSEMAPFDQMFYVSISLSVGGVNKNFFDSISGLKKPWENSSPSARLDFWESRADWLPSWQFGGSEFLVDYIRIYAV